MNRENYLKAILGTAVGTLGIVFTAKNSFAATSDINSKGIFNYDGGKVLIDAKDIQDARNDIETINEALGLSSSDPSTPGAPGAGSRSLLQKIEDVEAFLSNTHFIATKSPSTSDTLDAYNMQYKEGKAMIYDSTESKYSEYTPAATP